MDETLIKTYDQLKEGDQKIIRDLIQSLFFKDFTCEIQQSKLKELMKIEPNE